MEIVIGIVVVLVVIVVAITLVGRALPVAHVASRTATFRRPAEDVWAAINDPMLLSSRGAGDVKFETVESVPPKLLVRRVVGEKDFGGTSTCDIASVPGGSTLRITIDGTMAALRKRFGES